MNGLTKRQSELLQYIRDFITEKHYSPSFREIQAHFGFSSLGTVYNHIKVLKRKGMLKAEKQIRRSINPTSSEIGSYGIYKLPLAGQVRSGHPIELYTDVRDIDIPIDIVPHPENTYVLQVKGEGFNEELIADGDFIILEVTQKVHNELTMLLEINKNETLIKKIFDEGNFVRLEGKTLQNQSLILRKDDLFIHGIILAVIRNFK